MELYEDPPRGGPYDDGDGDDAASSLLSSEQEDQLLLGHPCSPHKRLVSDGEPYHEKLYHRDRDASN